MESKKERILYPDILRVLATFAVVLHHIAGKNMWAFKPTDVQYAVFLFESTIVKFAVPMFILLSGMFLLNPDKHIMPKDLFRKQMLRVMTSFVFWTVFYAAFNTFAAWDYAPETVPERMFNAIFVTRQYHLWFLPLIFGLYLVTPFLRHMVAGCSKKELTAFMLMAFIFASVLPLCETLKLLPALTALMRELGITMVTGCVGWYVAGIYLVKYLNIQKRGTRLLCYILGVVSILLAYYLTMAHALETGENIETWIIANAVTMVLPVIAVFVLVRAIADRLTFSEKSIKWITILAQDAFGIYLLHDACITVFESIGLSTLKFNPYIAPPVLAVLCFLLTWLVVHLLRKIPFARKFIL